MGDNMLENTINILNKARIENYAVPQFNINNLEWTKYILESANDLKLPVILGVSEGAINYMGGYNTVVNIVVGLMIDLKIKIPVVLHLDHASSLESCVKAIDAGFTSVMIDQSSKTLNENIKVTKEVVEYAKNYKVSVEAEVGHIGGKEDNISSNIAHAKVKDCIKLVGATGVDILAASVGSSHGIYDGKPIIKFNLIQEIRDATNLPLVLHGGSGIPNDTIKKAINSGIAKININTELQVVWTDALREFLETNKDIYDPRKVIGSGEKAIKDTIKKIYKLFKTK